MYFDKSIEVALSGQQIVLVPILYFCNSLSRFFRLTFSHGSHQADLQTRPEIPADLYHLILRNHPSILAPTSRALLHPRLFSGFFFLSLSSSPRRLICRWKPANLRGTRRGDDPCNPRSTIHHGWEEDDPRARIGI